MVSPDSQSMISSERPKLKTGPLHDGVRPNISDRTASSELPPR